MTYLQELVNKELERQENAVELIASENYCSRTIRRMMCSCLTNKYAEGYPGARYYGGCEYVDQVEAYCQVRWRQVFDTEYYCNVQPHSGTNANLAALLALAPLGGKVMAMRLSAGGHLSHGAPVSITGKAYDIVNYGVNQYGFIDYEEVQRVALQEKPAVIICGASSYSRRINFKRMASIARRCGAYLVADIAHIAGLVATGQHPSPFGLADVVTTTTHKTLRGPRGGLIFCRPHLISKVNAAVFPGTQGGPLMHVIAAKAQCADEILLADKTIYSDYITHVVKNASAFADWFSSKSVEVVSGGTDNHMFVLDISDFNVTGLALQEACEKQHIYLNKQCIPGDKLSPKITSGVRIGTPAMTTRGWTVDDFIEKAGKPIVKLLEEL